MRLPRLLLCVLALTGVSALLWVAVLVVTTEPAAHTQPEPRAAVTGDAVAPALAALRAWDAGRARAWASADLAALEGLYTDGSVAGARDVAMLRRWRDRGLRVEGMQTQVVAARVAARSADRVVVVVTDRLAGAVATGRGRRVPLPGDRLTTRAVTLHLVDRVWRVDSVVPSA